MADFTIKTEIEEEDDLLEVFKNEPFDEEDAEINFQPKKRKIERKQSYHNIREDFEEMIIAQELEEVPAVIFEEFQSPKVKATRKCLSFRDKLNVIERKNSGATIEELCEEFGTSRSTICCIIRKKKQFLEQIAMNPNLVGCKKFRTMAEPR